MIEVEVEGVVRGLATSGRPELVLAGRCPQSRRQRWLISLLQSSVSRRLPGVDVRWAAVDRGFPRVAELMYATSWPSVVVPLWLSTNAARSHTLEESVQLSRAPVTLTSALGPDPLLAEAVSQRLRAGGAHPSNTLVVTAPVRPGSEGHQDVCRAARLISARWGGRPVHVAVGADPNRALPPLLASLQRAGTRVSVAPYTLMPGSWVERCRSLAGACDVDGFGEALVHHPLVTELVARRYEQATSSSSSSSAAA